MSQELLMRTEPSKEKYSRLEKAMEDWILEVMKVHTVDNKRVQLTLMALVTEAQNTLRILHKLLVEDK